MQFNDKIFSWFSLFGLLLNFNLNAQLFSDVASSQGINLTTGTVALYGSGISFYDINHDGWDDDFSTRKRYTSNLF